MSELLLAGTDLMVWAGAHATVAALLFVALTAPAGVCWWLARRGVTGSHGGVQQIEHRLSHLCSAVELLTDTTESGLHSAFSEIQRLSKIEVERGVKKPGLQTRVRRAARGGKSTREIAHREGVSEGEVHLRLTLAGPPTPVAAAAH